MLNKNMHFLVSVKGEMHGQNRAYSVRRTSWGSGDDESHILLFKLDV